MNGTKTNETKPTPLVVQVSGMNNDTSNDLCRLINCSRKSLKKECRRSLYSEHPTGMTPKKVKPAIGEPEPSDFKSPMVGRS